LYLAEEPTIDTMKMNPALTGFLMILLTLSHVHGQDTEIAYLSGTGFDDTRTWDFRCSGGMNSGVWSEIEVPSCWEQQGFGAYHYGHTPFEERLKEEGDYRYMFRASEHWKGMHVSLVFEGVMTDAEVKLNGRPAGEVHQGAFYPFSYDVSGLLQYGKDNLLEVHVKKFSGNMSVNQAERKADYWIFGGIFRPVYLEIKPREHIGRVAVDAKADGSLYARATLVPGRKAVAMQLRILDEQGKECGRFSEEVDKNSGQTELRGKVEDVLTWSPEYPNLYTAEFSLLDAGGNTFHRMTEKIGFRTVEVRAQDGIYVNGKRIKFKGVNRHTFHPDHGRTSSRALSIEVVNLIKDMNMNAVRMSHYPPDRHFLDACDSLGLFVLDELAGWQRPPYDSVVGRKLLRAMVERDQNHPSVVLWDNGNEGGWNTAYDEDFSEIDIQGRDVIHPWASFGKTNTAHYVDYGYLSQDHFAGRQIFFPTELLHGLYDGGHGAGLEDYWLRMWNHPLCAGGFLWVFADEAVKRTDNGKLDGAGNQAPDGIVGPYHQKEGSYYAIREIWSPVHIEKRYLTPDFDGVFRVENRFHFTRLEDCSFTFRWVQLPAPGPVGGVVSTTGGKGAVIWEGVPQADPLLPGQKGTLVLDLPGNWRSADVLYLEAHDPHGRLIHRWSWPVKPPAETAAALAGTMPTAKGAAEREEFLTSDKVVLENAGIRIEINPENGNLLRVSSGDSEIPLKGGWIIDAGEGGPAGSAQFSRGGDQHFMMDFENGNRYHWVLRMNGLLDLKVAYRPQTGQVPYAGISFTFPETGIESVRYQGNGPYRVWKNRLKGVNFGVWDKAFNNTVTGHSEFIYPEFRGYYSDLYWADIRGGQGPGFRVYCHTEDIFLRLLTPGEAPEPRNTSVSHPSGDLSFMHGIPAIGTKFKTADKLGPQSGNYRFLARRVNDGYLDMTLTFDFKQGE